MNTFKQYGYPASPRFSEEDGWSIFISYIGFFKSSGDFHWDQVSPMFAIHVVLKGRGVFQRDGRKYVVGAGETFTFFPGDRVIYFDHPESPWEYIWFRLAGKNVEKALNASGITRTRPHRKISNPGKLEGFLHEIGAMYDKGRHPPLFPMTAACSCLDMISGGEGDVSTTQIGGKSIADSFVSIVETQMETVPSVGKIAAQMRIDRTTLFRAFIKEHGISPKKFLENRRMERAMELLSKTKLSVKEISDACGFSHPGQFCKVFSLRNGKTPAKWRISGKL
ncbi:MAG TPA: hypothetical protein DCZ94_19560 [Lentisphaeria bacterium]|nr:MAG: hypothetical protein A2X48_23765 [Lentisphaerae bacterium GWF2_49_21]HBC89142.1 hypothetical protein [Lentisphaeria bacterium]